MKVIPRRCPRCGGRTVVCRHKAITQKQLNKQFYYAYWYVCTNKECKTSLIMPEEARVYPGQCEVPGPVFQEDKLGSAPAMTTKGKRPVHMCAKEDCGILPWEYCPYSDGCNPF